MGLVQIIVFFMGLLITVPWVVFVIKSIRFDRDCARKGMRPVTDRDRILLFFNPKKIVTESRNEIEKSAVEEVLSWYRSEAKRAVLRSLAIFSFWLMLMLAVSFLSL